MSPAISIAFVHHKGGTGKTTSCLNISGYLVKAGRRVLVVDMDPQGNATGGLGIDQRTLSRSMYDVMMDETSIRNIILGTRSGIHLAPSTLDLVGAEATMYQRGENRLNVLDDKLADIRDFYDYIMIDTPPGAGLFMVNGTVASDHTIVTLDPSIFSLESVRTLHTIFHDIDETLGVQVNPLMAILTRCNKLSWFSSIRGKTDPVKDVMNSLRRIFRKVFMVPYSVEIYEAQLQGIPISHYKPDCKAGMVYKNIAREVNKIYG